MLTFESLLYHRKDGHLLTRPVYPQSTRRRQSGIFDVTLQRGLLLDSSSFPQVLDAIQPFPREFLFVPSKMSVTGSLPIDGPPQVQVRNHVARSKIELFTHYLGKLIRRDLTRSLGIHHEGDGLWLSDGIRNLELTTFG
jgi:hypothetical protein